MTFQSSVPFPSTSRRLRKTPQDLVYDLTDSNPYLGTSSNSKRSLRASTASLPTRSFQPPIPPRTSSQNVKISRTRTASYDPNVSTSSVKDQSSPIKAKLQDLFSLPNLFPNEPIVSENETEFWSTSSSRTPHSKEDKMKSRFRVPSNLSIPSRSHPAHPSSSFHESTEERSPTFSKAVFPSYTSSIHSYSSNSEEDDLTYLHSRLRSPKTSLNSQTSQKRSPQSRGKEVPELEQEDFRRHSWTPNSPSKTTFRSTTTTTRTYRRSVASVNSLIYGPDLYKDLGHESCRTTPVSSRRNSPTRSPGQAHRRTWSSTSLRDFPSYPPSDEYTPFKRASSHNTDRNVGLIPNSMSLMRSFQPIAKICLFVVLAVTTILALFSVLLASYGLTFFDDVKQKFSRGLKKRLIRRFTVFTSTVTATADRVNPLTGTREDAAPFPSSANSSPTTKASSIFSSPNSEDETSPSTAGSGNNSETETRFAKGTDGKGKATGGKLPPRPPLSSLLPTLFLSLMVVLVKLVGSLWFKSSKPAQSKAP